MILVLTTKQDCHSDAVIRILNSRGEAVLRINSEDLLTEYHISVSVDVDGTLSGEIADKWGRNLKLENLKSAWLRKPDYDFFQLQTMTPGRRFAASEMKHLIDVLYSLPGVTWINDPFVANKAKSKIQQLICAGKLGMRVPETLVTRSSSVAAEFFRACGNDVATKSIYTGSIIRDDGLPQGLLTRRLFEDEFFENVSRVELCPTKFQRYMSKAFELRITVVDGHVFAVRINSQAHEFTAVDWREYAEHCLHEVYSLPERVEKFCVDFIKAQGLKFGAMDFIVTPEGEYVFLENNPFGQYLWLEQETEVKISEKIADSLIKYGR